MKNKPSSKAFFLLEFVLVLELRMRTSPALLPQDKFEYDNLIFSSIFTAFLKFVEWVQNFSFSLRQNTLKDFF